MVDFLCHMVFYHLEKKKSPIIFRVEKGTAWLGGKSMIFEINFLSAKSYDLGHIPNFSKPQ